MDEAAAGELAVHHALRGFDAIHLEAALAARAKSATVPVCFSPFDVQLNAAAEAEGLTVLTPEAYYISFLWLRRFHPVCPPISCRPLNNCSAEADPPFAPKSQQALAIPASLSPPGACHLTPRSFLFVPSALQKMSTASQTCTRDLLTVTWFGLMLFTV